MNRRDLLAAVGASASATALAGCAQFSGLLSGCDSMDSTTVDVASASLSEEQLSHLVPFVYADLRPEYQQIIDEASGEGRHRSCPDDSDPVASFAEDVEARIGRQWNDYGGDPANRPDYLLAAYLERDGSYFELEVAVEDVVVSG